MRAVYRRGTMNAESTGRAGYCPPESGGQRDCEAIPRGVVPFTKRFGFGTTPPSLRSGTPPDSGGEFPHHLLQIIHHRYFAVGFLYQSLSRNNVSHHLYF